MAEQSPRLVDSCKDLLFRLLWPDYASQQPLLVLRCCPICVTRRLAATAAVADPAAEAAEPAAAAAFSRRKPASWPRTFITASFPPSSLAAPSGWDPLRAQPACSLRLTSIVFRVGFDFAVVVSLPLRVLRIRP